MDISLLLFVNDSWKKIFDPIPRQEWSDHWSTYRYAVWWFISQPRRAMGHDLLPSPRVVSNKLTDNLDKPDAKRTIALAVWGQFVHHDLAHTPVRKTSEYLTHILRSFGSILNTHEAIKLSWCTYLDFSFSHPSVSIFTDIFALVQVPNQLK